MFKVTLAQFPRDYNIARQLFEVYQKDLGIPLCFEGFDSEIQQLTELYQSPKGGILLAQQSGQWLGCAAIVCLEEGLGELKRVFLKPDYRGVGHGRTLVLQALQLAKQLGCSKLRLDTLPSMRSAIGLYLKLGFREIEPYKRHPIKGAKFMELSLEDFADFDS